MNHRVRGGLPRRQRHQQRLSRQARLQVVRQGPADDAAAEGVEDDRQVDEPFVEADGWGDALNAALISRGVLTRAGATINIAPPLVITSEEADDLVVRLDGALQEVESALGIR